MQSSPESINFQQLPPVTDTDSTTYDSQPQGTLLSNSAVIIDFPKRVTPDVTIVDDAAPNMLPGADLQNVSMAPVDKPPKCSEIVTLYLGRALSKALAAVHEGDDSAIDTLGMLKWYQIRLSQGDTKLEETLKEHYRKAIMGRMQKPVGGTAVQGSAGDSVMQERSIFPSLFKPTHAEWDATRQDRYNAGRADVDNL